MEYQVEKITMQIKIEKAIGKIFKTIILVFLIMLLIINLGMLYQKNVKNEEIPRIGDFSVFNIISESMKPTIEVNDLIIIKKCKQEELKIGDVITFKTPEETVVTHKIVKISKEDGKKVYITKGDNNKIEDSDPVEYEQIHGKYVFKISGAGRFAERLQENNGLISVALTIIIFIIIKNGNDKKKENRKRTREKYDIKKKRDEYNKKVKEL